MKRFLLFLITTVAVVMSASSQSQYSGQPMSIHLANGDSVAVDLMFNTLSPRYENGQFVWHIGDAYTLENVVNIEPRTHEQSLESARKALVRLYEATDGDHWNNNTNWCSDKPISEWFGVDNWGEYPYVVSLFLNGNNLNGQLPEGFFSGLGPIGNLGLSENHLTGPLPSDMNNLWNMMYLDISNNKLEGELPSNLNRFPNLGYLTVNENKLTGTIPQGLAKMMDQKSHLSLCGNDFSGSVPDDIINHPRFHLMWSDIVPQGGHLTLPTIPGYKLDVTDANGNQFNTTDIYKDNFYTLIFNYSSARGGFTDKLKMAYENYKKKGFEVLGMAPGNMDEVNDYLHANNISWLNLDPATFDDAIGKYYIYINFINLVDKDGNVVFTSIMDDNGKMEDTWGSSTRDQQVFDVLADKFGNVDFTPYFSTDFSRDGEVLTLQTATKGKGVDIVFLGNCFTDKDMQPGGRYETRMREAMEQFFAYEPYTSLRDRFNVYAVVAVSKNAELYEDTEHAIETDADAFNYAKKIPTYQDGDPLRVNVIYNSHNAGRSYTHMFYNDHSYVAFMFTGVNRILNHECGGHGIGRLFDEYVENSGSTADEGVKQYYEDVWTTYGYGANIDMHADVTQTRWAHLAADERYAGEFLGAYEGSGTFEYGIFRPTRGSMMRFNDSPFNAPSREAIYKYVMQDSEGPSWQYNYDTFVDFDEAGRKQFVDATYKPEQAPRKHQEDHLPVVGQPDLDDEQLQTLPPVIINGTWKDALKTPRKIVYQY